MDWLRSVMLKFYGFIAAERFRSVRLKLNVFHFTQNDRTYKKNVRLLFFCCRHYSLCWRLLKDAGKFESNFLAFFTSLRWDHRFMKHHIRWFIEWSGENGAIGWSIFGARNQFALQCGRIFWKGTTQLSSGDSVQRCQGKLCQRIFLQSSNI